MTLRQRALALLIERGRFPVGTSDWHYRTVAAWIYLQMAMGIPANKQTRTPPRVTVGSAVK